MLALLLYLGIGLLYFIYDLQPFTCGFNGAQYFATSYYSLKLKCIKRTIILGVQLIDWFIKLKETTLSLQVHLSSVLKRINI